MPVTHYSFKVNRCTEAVKQPAAKKTRKVLSKPAPEPAQASEKWSRDQKKQAKKAALARLSSKKEIEIDLQG